MALPFEFIIDGPPVSQQTRSRQRRTEWTQEVRAGAVQYWGQAYPFTHPVMVTVTHFFGRVELDVDNIPKLILDGLKGLVYVDDSQVTDMLCRKRNLNDTLRVHNPSLVLSDALGRGDEFLHIVVEDSAFQEVIS